MPQGFSQSPCYAVGSAPRGSSPVSCGDGPSPLVLGLVYDPLGRGPPRLQGPKPRPQIVVAPAVSPKPPLGAGTGLVRIEDEVRPPAPASPKPANLVLPPRPPMGRSAPLLVGPVGEAVADRMRALELIGSFMDVPEVEALSARLIPPSPPSPEPSMIPVGSWHKSWLTSASDRKNAGALCGAES